MPGKQPDILIFNPDSYRGDVLGHLGTPGAVTPNLDAIIRDGAVSYANAFAQNPVCTPSRCSFMTGWYPHVHGHRSMRNMLKPHDPSLFQVLRREGYHVWWGGKNDLFAVGKPDDYLLYCDTKYDAPSNRYKGFRPPPPLAAADPRRGAYYGGVMPADPAAEYGDSDRAWVEGAVDLLSRPRQGDQPLCTYLPLHSPHPAYHVEQKYYDRIDPDALSACLPRPASGYPPVLDALWREYGADRICEQDWREVKRIYYAMCAKVDDLFGQVVSALRTSGRYENTLILFFSDHGDFTGDYALPEKTHSTLQDALLRVPFLIKPPAGVPVQPGVRKALTELIDMPATIYDLLDIAPEYTVQGKSLRASLAGQDHEIHEAVFAEVGSRLNEGAFRNSDVDKMPPGSFYAIQSKASRSSFPEGGSYAVSCRTRDFKYVRRGYTPPHELYDLRNDPGELQNRIGQPAYAEIERGMERRLLDFFMTTGDVMPFQQDSRQI